MPLLSTSKRVGDAGSGSGRGRQRDPDDQIDDRWTETSRDLVHQFG
jgi:hypothetical protein